MQASSKLDHAAPVGLDPSLRIPAEISSELRRLAHDLSNSIETIMQASYLLGMSPLDEASQKWSGLIENATREAARINREIREVLRSHSS